MKKYVYLLLLITPAISFAQNRHEDDGRHRGNKNNNTVFSFWFNSKPARKLIVFDRHFIFDSDTMASNTIEKTKSLQNQFRQELRLVDVQIDYLVREMEGLLDQQQKGVDNKQKILDTYTKLHHLNMQHFDMIGRHAKEIQQIFDDSFVEYNKKINQKIEQSKDNPNVILVDLAERYQLYKQNQ